MWYLIIQLVLLTPKEGTVLMSSGSGFITLAICEEHKKSLEPKLDEMIRSAVGKDITYQDAHIDCRQIKNERGA